MTAVVTQTVSLIIYKCIVINFMNIHDNSCIYRTKKTSEKGKKGTRIKNIRTPRINRFEMSEQSIKLVGRHENTFINRGAFLWLRVRADNFRLCSVSLNSRGIVSHISHK